MEVAVVAKEPCPLVPDHEDSCLPSDHGNCPAEIAEKALCRSPCSAGDCLFPHDVASSGVACVSDSGTGGIVDPSDRLVHGLDTSHAW